MIWIGLLLPAEAGCADPAALGEVLEGRFAEAAYQRAPAAQRSDGLGLTSGALMVRGLATPGEPSTGP